MKLPVMPPAIPIDLDGRIKTMTPPLPIETKDDSVANFTRDVNKMYDRQAIEALRVVAGTTGIVKIPPRPLVMATAMARSSPAKVG